MRLKLQKKKVLLKKRGCNYTGRTKWIRKSRQSTGYVNPSGISTHPVCYCVCVYRKRATAEEGLNHPWLNSHPHLHSVKASSLEEPEMSQSESEPESPACSPELDLIGSYLLYPGQGELKTGRHAFSFSEPPFATRPEIQQELICWDLHQQGETALTPRSPRLIGLDPTWGPCFRAACTAVLPVRWCFWYLSVFSLANLCWSVIARKEWKSGERSRNRGSSSLSVGCTAGMDWAHFGYFMYENCFFFFSTSVTVQAIFRGEAAFCFLRK